MSSRASPSSASEMLAAGTGPSAASGRAAAGMGGASGAAGTGGPRASGGAGGNTVAAGASDAGAARDAGSRDADAADASAAPVPDASTADAAAVTASIHCPNGASYPDPLPPPSDRTAKLLRDGFGFVEGPVWVDGALLFSDMDFATSNNAQGPNSQIRRFVPPDQFDVLVPSSGSNGLALANDGRVLAATHDSQSLSYFDASTGARESRELAYQGKHFNSPNDLAVRSDGTVYFSDPNWQLGPRTSEIGKTGFYRVAPDGTVSLIDDSVNQPNGVAISPDERTLYAGSQGSEIYAFPLAADGTPGARTTFAAPGGSDGMTIDCAGNLYVASNTVQVFAPDGKKLGEITVGANPSNMAFGGPEAKTLYITAQSGLYTIELNVPGRCY